MESGKDFGFEKKEYRIYGKEEILANGQTAKIEKENLKSIDPPRAKILRCNMNKVGLCLYPKWPWPHHNMMMKVLLLNGDDTTDGDDVVGDIADGYDVNGDEDDDDLRNFPPASEMTLAQHRTISHQGRHTFDTFVV